jgi:SAM-dependent methyltransferase
MSIFRGEDVFKRSGLVSLSDLKSSEYQKIFSELEIEDHAFLAKEAEFRSPGYRWQRDAMHYWSSIWEYPYTYYHLKEHAAALGLGFEAKVVDLGSAVTFFPFAIAKLGYHVSCLDIEPAYEPDIQRAVAVVPHQPGKVDFRLISDGRLPFKDGEVNAVYCISVLEHIPDFENSVREVFRILKPKGLFVLTFDIDLCGYRDISIGRYYDLRRCLLEHFDLKEPEITVHPLDVLQPRNGPFPCMTYSKWQEYKFYVKQRIKPLFGRKPFYSLHLPFVNICVWAGVMTKRNEHNSTQGS